MRVNVSERVGVVNIKGVPVVVATSTIEVNGEVDCYLAEAQWPVEYDGVADDYLYGLTPLLVELEVKGYIPQVDRRVGGLSLTASKPVHVAAVAKAA